MTESIASNMRERIQRLEADNGRLLRENLRVRAEVERLRDLVRSLTGGTAAGEDMLRRAAEAAKVNP